MKPYSSKLEGPIKYVLGTFVPPQSPPLQKNYAEIWKFLLGWGKQFCSFYTPSKPIFAPLKINCPLLA